MQSSKKNCICIRTILSYVASKTVGIARLQIFIWSYSGIGTLSGADKRANNAFNFTNYEVNTSMNSFHFWDCGIRKKIFVRVSGVMNLRSTAVSPAAIVQAFTNR